jgi:hypothetical protein
MIYTYSTILLASSIVALIALYLYRLISRSGRSVQNSMAASKEAKATRVSAGRHSHVIPRNLVQGYPAMHAVNRDQDNVWPYREIKTLDVGTFHKVRRRKAGEKPTHKTTQKPWGW